MKRFVVIVALAALALSACARTVHQGTRPEGSLAIAGFSNPAFTAELIAGYLPEEGVRVKPEILAGLNQALTETLQAHGTMGYKSMGEVRQCEEVRNYKDPVNSTVSALKYWLGVGKCAGVEYILVPQLLSWKERQGSTKAVASPASVMFDLYLLNVKEGRVAARYHFDETQEPLTSNLLDAPRFFQRSAKWISADELSREGLDAGLRYLGL